MRHNSYLFYFKLQKLSKFLFIYNSFSYLSYLQFSDRICYDDASHLKKLMKTLTRNRLTSTAKKMSQMVMVCHKLHFKNNKDMWCKRNCSPYTCASLQVRFPLIQFLTFTHVTPPLTTVAYRHLCTPQT